MKLSCKEIKPCKPELTGDVINAAHVHIDYADSETKYSFTVSHEGPEDKREELHNEFLNLIRKYV